MCYDCCREFLAEYVCATHVSRKRKCYWRYSKYETELGKSTWLGSVEILTWKGNLQFDEYVFCIYAISLLAYRFSIASLSMLRRIRVVAHVDVSSRLRRASNPEFACTWRAYRTRPKCAALFINFKWYLHERVHYGPRVLCALKHYFERKRHKRKCGEDCQLRNGFFSIFSLLLFLRIFPFQNVRSNTNFSTFIGIGIWIRT